jgi:cellulose synthase/poly-beta-1,6-N-acetylglucosamine synthase-like glycosyltransferase
MRNARPTITIVICARNAAAHLRRCIPAATGQDYPRGRFRVLVVDNGSSDETARVARELGASVRSHRPPGVAGARQFGWRVARSELIAFLDADCEPPRDWLARLASGFAASPRVGAVGSRLVNGPATTLAERHIAEAGVLDTDRCWQRNALQFPYVVTAGMMVRRAALEAVGGFDLSLGRAAGEDADLCWRLERAGWEVRYAREVEVIHHHRATVGAMLRQVHWYGAGSAALFARWRGELGWWRYTDWSVYRRLAGGLAGALPALLTGGDRYGRLAPALRALDAAAFLAGKWRGAARNRVLFL